jgi:hypothetical protein
VKRSKLDEDTMLSELSGSAFFRGRSPVQPSSAQGSKDESAHAPITPDAQSSKIENAHAPFDLTKKAEEKRGYRFTQEEIWAIEDVKRELNREMDLGISQEDIVRAGVHYVIEDYRKSKNKSFIVEKVKAKRKGS